jgi:4,5-dihydroxyphthalate decarboxylase
MNRSTSNRKYYGITLTAICLFGFCLGGFSQEATAKKLKLNVAGYDYDRVLSIMNGHAGIEGAEIEFKVTDIYDMVKSTFGSEQKYDITEIGLVPFIAKYINNDFRDYTLIPVFISRTFRHRNIFVHTDSGIEKAESLRGKRIGTPGYGMSSHVWIRGMLLDEYGIKADDMQWIETTKSSDGGKWKNSTYYFSDDFPIKTGPPNVDESELLLTGGCDALITAITPKAYLDGNPKIRRLFIDSRSAEKEYYKKTGLFPIMHAVAIRTELVKEHPWLPQAVFEMYSKSKLKAYANMEGTTSLKVTLPWVVEEFEETRKIMGENFWTYGFEANRKELENVMRYVYEQGLVGRHLKAEEIFHPTTLNLEESNFTR